MTTKPKFALIVFTSYRVFTIKRCTVWMLGSVGRPRPEPKPPTQAQLGLVLTQVAGCACAEISCPRTWLLVPHETIIQHAASEADAKQKEIDCLLNRKYTAEPKDLHILPLNPSMKIRAKERKPWVTHVWETGPASDPTCHLTTLLGTWIIAVFTSS